MPRVFIVVGSRLARMICLARREPQVSVVSRPECWHHAMTQSWNDSHSGAFSGALREKRIAAAVSEPMQIR